jgi:hypothetical protein
MKIIHNVEKIIAERCAWEAVLLHMELMQAFDGTEAEFTK